MWRNHKSRTLSSLFHDHKIHLLAVGPFYRAEISLPFYVLERAFHIAKAWKMYPFRAEPSRVGYYRDSPWIFALPCYKLLLFTLNLCFVEKWPNNDHASFSLKYNQLISFFWRCKLKFGKRYMTENIFSNNISTALTKKINVELTMA